MVSAVISRLVVLTAGTLYPAYRSYKAVRTKDVREYVKWMMYWIVFALYLVVETLADVFVSFWCPFYYELKMIFVIWLLSPWTKGASLIYRKFIHPTLTRHERDIDQYLDKAKNEGCSALMRFGSRSLIYVREVVASAAIKGQVQLVQQLKKSYSMNDIDREEEDLSGQEVDIPDAPRGRRRRVSNTSNRLRIEEIREESDEGPQLTDEHEEDDEGHVVRGYYDGGREVVEEEFRYLYDEDGDPSTAVVRRSKRARKPVNYNNQEDTAFATLPRAAGRRKNRSGIPQEYL